MPRAVLALLVALAGLVSADVAAAGTSPNAALVLTGTHHATAVLTIERTTRYDLGAARVAFTGTYGGFAIGQDKAAMWSAVVPRDRPTFFGESATAGVLTPGKYVVKLFSGGWPVTAVIPWDAPGVRLDVTDDLDADVQVTTVPVGPDGDGTQVVALDVPSRSRVDALVRFDSSAELGPVAVQACVTRTPSTCAGADWSGISQMPVRDSTVSGVSKTWRRDDPSPLVGRHVRGEVDGTVPGVLSVVVLRYPT